MSELAVTGSSDLPSSLHDFDAEMCVLSACMLDDTPDGRWRRKALNALKPGAFVNPDHRTLFESIREMVDAGTQIDAITVRDKLKSSGRLEDLGGVAYIAQILSMLPSASHVESYIKIVLRFAGLRMASSTGRRIEMLAREANADPVVIMRQAAIMLAEGARRLSGGGDRVGGAEELDEMTRAILAGQGQNIELAGAPDLSFASKALVPSSVVILGGEPGDGKTFWILQNLIEWREQGINSAVAMLEKSRAWHLNRCRAILGQDGQLADEAYLERNPDHVHQVTDRYRDFIEKIGNSIFTADQFDTSLGGIANWIDARADESPICIVDPISAATTGQKRWIEDQDFMQSVLATTKRTGCRVILVTHPSGGERKGPPSLDWICGGQTYKRNTDCVLYVQKLEPMKTFTVRRNRDLQSRVTCNRRVSILKSRNGRGGGMKFAMHFDPRTLTYSEQGAIVKEDAPQEAA